MIAFDPDRERSHARATPSPRALAARARWVRAHLHLPRRAAAMIHPRVRRYMELEELVALGNLGLAEAAARYQPGRGTSFATFAWYRVQGAILDALRRETRLPRGVWRRLVALREAAALLERRAEAEREPASGAAALAAVRRAMSEIRTMYLTSLDKLRDRGLEPAGDAEPPGGRIDRERMSARMLAGLARLPDVERTLVVQHYWGGKTLREAGAALGISKSWASRLHDRAVRRLRIAVEP